MILMGKTQTQVDAESLAKLATSIKSKRDGLIDDIYWRVERYQTQLALGIATTDSEANYKIILQYIQDLRDLPTQVGFPSNVTFPALTID